MCQKRHKIVMPLIVLLFIWLSYISSLWWAGDDYAISLEAYPSMDLVKQPIHSSPSVSSAPKDESASSFRASPSKETISIITRSQSHPKRRLYDCGWPLPRLRESLFGNSTDETSSFQFDSVGQYYRGAPSDSSDILFYGMDGDCEGSTRKTRIKPDYIETNFAGKALFVNGEPFGSIFPLDKYSCGPRFGCPKSTDHLYQVGSVLDSDGAHALRVFYAAVILLEHFEPDQRRWIFEHDHKRHMERPAVGKMELAKQIARKTKRTSTVYPFRNAALYMSRRCVKARQYAAGNVSTIVPLHAGGYCQPDIVNKEKQRVGRLPAKAFSGSQGREQFWDNYKLYAQYKYCMCMENSGHDGYISEKLILAFLGGCLPIYWGTAEVFEVFNANAFIYYDVNNPQIALDKIRYLESNYTAYREILLNEPILKNGDTTVRDFFSLSDDIGGGALKKKILDMLEIKAR